MTTFEMSPEKYADQYLRDLKQHTNRNMAYGSLMADGLEFDESTGDPLLDAMIAQIPKFELRDQPLEADLPFKKGHIRLLAKPDTSKADYSAFKEYKTSVRKWTQKMVDNSGQISFYATTMWLKTGKIPQDIELVNVQVMYTEDGKLTPTGAILRFPTKRTMVDIIKMTGRMKKAWQGICDLCEKELL